MFPPPVSSDGRRLRRRAITAPWVSPEFPCERDFRTVRELVLVDDEREFQFVASRRADLPAGRLAATRQTVRVANGVRCANHTNDQPGVEKSPILMGAEGQRNCQAALVARSLELKKASILSNRPVLFTSH
jgi:hypothetical protein